MHKLNKIPLLVFLFVGIIIYCTSCKKDPTLPVVTTASISDIEQTSAASGGEVTGDGGASVTARGVCWNTLEKPTTEHNKTTDGQGKGTFTSHITGLTPGTVYYIRAYAVNEVGTAYGKQESFTSGEILLPSLTTNEVTDITLTSAVSGAEITDDGGGDITARGICWNTDGNPTTDDNKTEEGTGTGSFTSTISGLDIGTTYYVRAYATNSAGIAYGNEVSFTTEDVLKATITTNEVTEISQISAVSGGNITNDGGGEITARGVCWSTSESPTTDDNFTDEGTGTGTFTSNLTNLNGSTTYYVRAYATNSAGTAYGNEVSFTTEDAQLATLTTDSPVSITQTTAASGGNITDNGGGKITAKGVCWSISQNPTTADNYTEDGTGTGTFTSTMEKLNTGTTYYVRAYATNIAGTSYGNEKSFTTEQLTDIDGNIYQTVIIGNQIWMAENLKTTSYADGTPIQLVTGADNWESLIITEKAYCWYDDDSITYAQTYGALYTWAAAMNGASSSTANPSAIQGVCPTGWHLPSNAEWLELADYLGGSSVAGGKIKETGTAHWRSPNTGATNETGFTALPGGIRESDGTFIYLREQGIFHSATELYDDNSHCRVLWYSLSSLQDYHASKKRGNSVRCLKD